MWGASLKTVISFAKVVTFEIVLLMSRDTVLKNVYDRHVEFHMKISRGETNSSSFPCTQ